jgi:hypothetical protein
LPCSRASSSASSSFSLRISSRNFIITRARRCGLVAAQAGCAAWRSRSRLLDLGLRRPARPWPRTSPVIGWKTSAVRPDVPDMLAADEMSDLTHFCLPIADKLHVKLVDEETNRTLIIDGVLMMRDSKSPALVREMLLTYLPEKHRDHGEELAAA